MSNDPPVISSKYGVRPLLDIPAMDIGSGPGTWKPSHLATMVPPHMYRLNPPEPQQQIQPVPPPPAIPLPMAVPRPQLPMDWPYAMGLPGSLFAAPPGPMPYRSPHMFPYSFLHMPPFTLQPPPWHFMDSSGQPLQRPQNLSPEQQYLSRLYPGVYDPCPPQAFNAPPGGLPPPGLVPQGAAQQPQATTEPQAAETGRVHFEGVLTFGKLALAHSPDMTIAFDTLPEFLRLELENTYGHVPATDVRIVMRHGEFHVYALPRKSGGDITGREQPSVTDQRLFV